MSAVCDLKQVEVAFPTQDSRAVQAVRDVTFELGRGESLGIVGESGSGKSTLVLSMLGLVPYPGVVDGSIVMGGVDMARARAGELSRVRGRRVALIPQDATSSLNPVRTIGAQLRETCRHAGIRGRAADDAIAAGLREVELDPDRVLGRYAWQLSGGMNQRVAIAMSLLQQPDLVIADEPTSALDVTIQASILGLLRRLAREREMALVIISHDLGVVYQLADRVLVMYAGEVVESGETERIITTPEHPYTIALLGSMVELDARPGEIEGIPGVLQRMYEGDDFCPFAARCPIAMDICRSRRPPEQERPDGRRLRCWAVGGDERREVA